MRPRTAWTFAVIACAVTAGLAVGLSTRGAFDESRESRTASREEAPAKPPGLQPAAGARAAPRPDPLSPDDLASAPFEGAVVDENGVPIGGAELRVTTGWGKDRHVDLADYATATSGPDGRFVIPSKAWVERLYVRASALGRAPAVAQSAMGHGGADTRVVLLTAAMVRVRVEDGTTHAPIAGARVYAFCGSDGGRQDLSAEVNPVASAESDTDRLGLATLSTPGGWTQVLVRSRDHEPAVLKSLEVPPAGLDVVVSLSPGGTLEGRVLDPARKPVSGARIVVTGPNAYVGHATTDDAGTFSLAHVPSDTPKSGTYGPLTATAIVPGWPRVSNRKIFRPLARELRSVELVLRPWVSIRGTVRGSAGELVPGVKIEAAEYLLGGLPQTEMLGARSETTTDSRGEFLIRDFSPEGGPLWASAGGRTGMESVEESQVDRPIEVRLGDNEQKVEPPVAAGTGVIGGCVVRVDGSPALVRVRVDRRIRTADGRESYVGPSEPVATSADGLFRFERLADGDYLIYVADSGLEFIDYPRYVSPGETDLRLLVLTPAEEVSCHPEVEAVDAESGGPIAMDFAEATVSSKGGGAGPTHTMLLQPVAGGLARSRLALVPGTYAGTLKTRGYRDVDLPAFRVPDGGRAPRVQVRLTVAAHVEGSVLDADGRPVPGRVNVVHLRQHATAGPDGRYSMKIASESVALLDVRGDYIVSAERHDQAPASSGGRRRVDFVVRTGGTVRVRFKDDRRPERELTLRIGTLDAATGESISEQSAGTFDHKVLDRSGPEFSLEAMFAGRYRITPIWDDTELAPRDVEVRDRETTTIDIAAP